MSTQLDEFLRESIDKLLKRLPPEKRLEEIPPEERLAGVSAEKTSQRAAA